MWKKVSGCLRQTQELRGGLAPIGIDQPRLEQAGAIAMIAGCPVIAPTGSGEGQPAQAAGFGDDAAGIRVRGDRLLPKDDSGADLAAENQAEIGVLNGDDTRAKRSVSSVLTPISPRVTRWLARIIACSADADWPMMTVWSKPLASSRS